ncbi:DNA ligase 3 isoform X2 [Rhodnius prolixus]|uniref:DNA ligase 3 isoform X2 n=1 Tax=Rhodnius prolixus TaxID=13249 RepID=UPI003D18C2CB
MSDEESDKEKFLFYADRAKSGRAGCKKCKQKIASGELRMAKAASNPFGSGVMKMWHHVDCMFQVFAKQRASTAKIESVNDIGGWELLSKEDREEILNRLPDSVRETNKKPVNSSASKTSPTKTKKTDQPSTSGISKNEPNILKDHKDNSLREFRRLCADIANTPGYLDKTAVVKRFITEGTDKESYKGDLLLLIKLLLPGVIKRVYNLQSKQIIKLFSRLFGTNQDDMLESLEQGDVAETIREYFEKSEKIKPSTKSKLSIQDVDNFLDYLTRLTREEDQLNHFASIAPKCTANDLKIIIRLIKRDLRINAGAKHILDAVHADAYEAFQASQDIDSIIESFQKSGDPTSGSVGSSVEVKISVLVPVLPMLAQACKSADEALKKCPNGMYSEIKYDGERVQVHKQGKTFKYYSRSLKPVMAHKVKHLQEYIPQAFPHGKDLILDSEILMIDTTTGKPLPFGSLGKHKTKKELEMMMTDVFKQGLEGLVLKDIMSVYEPGKRHWLKVKKDYLFGGAMADSADLVVLGAWYGTGQKGGMMSVFLMGCYDERNARWCTVTKVHTGHDDKTLKRLQTELDMVKIGKDSTKVPSWLNCSKTMVPDFVAQDPKKQPVWEITGAELTKNIVHTADGISVRFPRVTRIRDDKDWSTATTLDQLRELYEKSKHTTDFTLDADVDVTPPSSPEKKRSPRKRPADSPPGTNAPKKGKYKIRNPLPDIFIGMKIVLPAFITDNEREILERYFIAYGGEIVENKKKNKVTHKIVPEDEIDESDRTCLTMEQLWKSIREQKFISRIG